MGGPCLQQAAHKGSTATPVLAEQRLRCAVALIAVEASLIGGKQLCFGQCRRAAHVVTPSECVSVDLLLEVCRDPCIRMPWIAVERLCMFVSLEMWMSKL